MLILTKELAEKHVRRICMRSKRTLDQHRPGDVLRRFIG